MNPQNKEKISSPKVISRLEELLHSSGMNFHDYVMTDNLLFEIDPSRKGFTSKDLLKLSNSQTHVTTPDDISDSLDISSSCDEMFILEQLFREKNECADINIATVLRKLINLLWSEDAYIQISLIQFLASWDANNKGTEEICSSRVSSRLQQLKESQGTGYNQLCKEYYLKIDSLFFNYKSSKIAVDDTQNNLSASY
jgi:hypothetical protein